MILTESPQLRQQSSQDKPRPAPIAGARFGLPPSPAHRLPQFQTHVGAPLSYVTAHLAGELGVPGGDRATRAKLEGNSAPRLTSAKGCTTPPTCDFANPCTA